MSFYSKLTYTALGVEWEGIARHDIDGNDTYANARQIIDGIECTVTVQAIDSICDDLSYERHRITASKKGGAKPSAAAKRAWVEANLATVAAAAREAVKNQDFVRMGQLEMEMHSLFDNDQLKPGMAFRHGVLFNEHAELADKHGLI